VITHAPDRYASFGPYFDVNLYCDPPGDLWIAECDTLSVATEAPTLDALIKRVWEIAPEIAELNGHKDKLMLRFTIETSAAS
jgi:hypothetical protein